MKNKKTNKRTYEEIKKTVTGKATLRGYMRTPSGNIKAYFSPGIKAMEDDYKNAIVHICEAVTSFFAKDFGIGDCLGGCYPSPLGDTMETGGIMVSYIFDSDGQEVLYVYLQFETPASVIQH